MKNNFKILIACEENQTVCIEFRKLGFEAYSCDIIACSGGHPEWHINDDVLSIINGYCNFTTMDGKVHNISREWDLIVAFPPCTYLSNAGACRLYPEKGVLNIERYKKGLEAKDFFMSLLNANCNHIAVENPVSSKIFNMPKFSQEIQPYQFDVYYIHPYTKKTRLWLVNLPLLIYTTPNNIPVGPYVPSGTSRKNRDKYGAAKRGDDAKNRAKTFVGVAKAMAEQWGKFLIDNKE